MTVPGVGPAVALTYRATVDAPRALSEVKVCRRCLWIDALAGPISRARPDAISRYGDGAQRRFYYLTRMAAAYLTAFTGARRYGCQIDSRAFHAQLRAHKVTDRKNLI